MSEDTKSKPINPNKFAKQAPRVVTIDDQTHKHQRYENGQSPTFDAGCRACVRADRDRKPVPDSELATTVFFYGRDGHSQKLAQEYLDKRYPGMDIEHGAHLPIWALASADIQIVCVRALSEPGKPILSREVTTKDAWGQPVQVARDNEEMLAQVCESAPLKTSELCHLSGGNSGRIAVSGKWNCDALIHAISECMAGYRVNVPDAKHPDEHLSAFPL